MILPLPFRGGDLGSTTNHTATYLFIAGNDLFRMKTSDTQISNYQLIISYLYTKTTD